MCKNCGSLTGYPLDVYTAALTQPTGKRRPFVARVAPELLGKLGPMLDEHDAADRRREARARHPARAR